MPFIRIFLALWLGLTPAFAGKMSLLGAGASAAGGGGYTGPGDIVSGAIAWWGLRAYNAAYATGSNPAIDVCDHSTGLTCSTINILSNGNLDVATAAAAPACSVQCDITKWYDQTGNANHVTQTLSLNRTVFLTFSCLGALPCGTSNVTGASYISAGSVVAASPITMSSVSNRTTNVTSFQAVIDFNDNNSFLGFVNSANTARLAGSAGQIAPTAADNAWHAMNGVLNGASSVLNVDGTETSGSLTTPSENSPACFLGSSGSQCSSNPLAGKIAEGGIWATAFSGTQRTNLCHNQFTYWGTATSC
jgi:hypothetical protein